MRILKHIKRATGAAKAAMRIASILMLATSLPAQGQLTFGQITTQMNCTWEATSAASLSNVKVDMYKELKAISATAPTFTAYKITVIDVPSVNPLAGIAAIDTRYRQVVFEGTAVIADSVTTFKAGEQSCITREFDALTAIVALNNAAVDAVFVKYKVVLVNSSGVRIFPR